MNIEKIILIFVCSKWAGLSVSDKSSIFLGLKRRPTVPSGKKTNQQQPPISILIPSFDFYALTNSKFQVGHGRNENPCRVLQMIHLSLISFPQCIHFQTSNLITQQVLMATLKVEQQFFFRHIKVDMKKRKSFSWRIVLDLILHKHSKSFF